MCPLVSSGLKCAAKIHLELQFCVVPGLQFVKGMAESNNRALERPSLLRSVTSRSLPTSLRRQTAHFPSQSCQEASWWVCESKKKNNLEERQRCCLMSFVTQPERFTPLLSSWLGSQNSKALYLTRPVLPECLPLAAGASWMLDVFGRLVTEPTPLTLTLGDSWTIQSHPGKVQWQQRSQQKSKKPPNCRFQMAECG